MLDQLLRELNYEFPDSSILFRAIKDATVLNHVLTLAVASPAIAERMNDPIFKIDLLRIAKGLDPAIRSTVAEVAHGW